MALKWIPLDGKKDPQVGKRYVVVNKRGEWDKMGLEEIKITSSGKTYVFHDLEGSMYTDMTHYLDIESNIQKIEPPKNSQQ